MAERLCPPTQQSESWTYIFPGITRDVAESKLDEFHQSNVSCFFVCHETVQLLTASTVHPTP